MSLALSLLAQSVVTLAAPNASPLPGTAWSCSYVDASGNDFGLNGDFPEAPKGWDPNTGMPTQVSGNGPSAMTGTKLVNAFESGELLRTYMVSYLDRDGSRYNLMFNFVKESDGLSTITHYVPALDGKGKLHAYATGHCKSTFHALGKGAQVK